MTAPVESVIVPIIVPGDGLGRGMGGTATSASASSAAVISVRAGDEPTAELSIAILLRSGEQQVKSTSPELPDRASARAGATRMCCLRILAITTEGSGGKLQSYQVRESISCMKSCCNSSRHPIRASPFLGLLNAIHAGRDVLQSDTVSTPRRGPAETTTDAFADSSEGMKILVAGAARRWLNATSRRS